MLGAEVRIAAPAVAQKGQTCVAYGSDARSEQKWNCPERNTNPRSNTKTTRMFIRGI